MRNCIKRLTEVSGDIVHCPLCILRAYRSIIEDRFIGLIFHYLFCLSIPSYLFVLWVPRNGFQNLLHKATGTEAGLTHSTNTPSCLFRKVMYIYISLLVCGDLMQLQQFFIDNSDQSQNYILLCIGRRWTFCEREIKN